MTSTRGVAGDRPGVVPSFSFQAAWAGDCSVNTLNQCTRVSHPVDDNSKTFFKLRGTRSAGFQLRVHGHAVDATNTALSGYQPTNNGT